MILCVELNEAAVRNEPGDQTTFGDWHYRVSLWMSDKHRALDPARRVLHVNVPPDAEQSNSRFRRGRTPHLFRPGTQMLERAARLEC
jgi:hypothetical protein